jgi:hypothetical protein
MAVDVMVDDVTNVLGLKEPDVPDYGVECRVTTSASGTNRDCSRVITPYGHGFAPDKFCQSPQSYQNINCLPVGNIDQPGL